MDAPAPQSPETLHCTQSISSFPPPELADEREDKKDVGRLEFWSRWALGSGAKGKCFNSPGLSGSPPGEGSVRGAGGPAGKSSLWPRGMYLP